MGRRNNAYVPGKGADVHWSAEPEPYGDIVLIVIDPCSVGRKALQNPGGDHGYL